MKIELRVTPDDVRECTRPYSTAAYVVPVGTCPSCKAQPFEVSGGRQVRGHATITAPAGCRACRAQVGDLVVMFPTLFGLDEDERIASMGIKIY